MIGAPKQIIRGTDVRFRAKFLDYNNVAVVGGSAYVVLRYNIGGILTTERLGMSYDPDNSVYFVIWNTLNKDTGRVSFHIYQEGEGNVADDGELVIVANPANLENY